MLDTTVPGRRRGELPGIAGQAPAAGDDEVGAGDELLDRGAVGIRGDRALAVAQVAEQRAVAVGGVAGPLPVPERVAGGGLDTGDRRPGVGEQLRAVGAAEVGRQVDDHDVAKFPLIGHHGELYHPIGPRYGPIRGSDLAWAGEERPHRTAGLRGGRGPPTGRAERAVPAPRACPRPRCNGRSPPSPTPGGSVTTWASPASGSSPPASRCSPTPALRSSRPADAARPLLPALRETAGRLVGLLRARRRPHGAARRAREETA